MLVDLQQFEFELVPVRIACRCLAEHFFRLFVPAIGQIYFRFRQGIHLVGLDTSHTAP